MEVETQALQGHASSAIDFTADVTCALTFNVANTDQVTPGMWAVGLEN